MHIKRMVSAVLTTAAFIMLFTSCASPRSKDKVVAALESTMSIGFRYISTTTGKTTDGYDKKIYSFEDENGVGFKVLSGVYKSSMGPYSGEPSCDYACALFDEQKDTVLKSVQSDLHTELLDGYDRDGILEGNGISIKVSRYSDLEKVPQLVENALNSIEPFPFDSSLDPHECRYYFPVIKVVAPNGRIIRSYEFKSEEVSKYPVKKDGVSELQGYYLHMMRRGEIDREELAVDIWESFPAKSISTIYVNGEKMDYSRSHSYVEDIGGYQLWKSQVFANDGIFAKYVKQINGESTVEGKVKTWLLNGDTWIALECTDAAEKKAGETLRYHYEVTKNGEALEIPDRSTFEAFGDILGFEVRIDQVEPAIHFITKSQ